MRDRKLSDNREETRDCEERVQKVEVRAGFYVSGLPVNLSAESSGSEGERVELSQLASGDKNDTTLAL